MNSDLLQNIINWITIKTPVSNWILITLGFFSFLYFFGKLKPSRSTRPRKQSKRLPTLEEKMLLILTKRDGKPMPSYVLLDGFPEIKQTKLLHHLSELKGYRYIGGSTSLELTKFGRAYLVKHNLVGPDDEVQEENPQTQS